MKNLLSLVALVSLCLASVANASEAKPTAKQACAAIGGAYAQATIIAADGSVHVKSVCVAKGK